MKVAVIAAPIPEPTVRLEMTIDDYRKLKRIVGKFNGNVQSTDYTELMPFAIQFCQDAITL